MILLQKTGILGSQKAVHKIPYFSLAMLLIDELKAQKFAAEDSLQEKERLNQGSHRFDFHTVLIILKSIDRKKSDSWGENAGSS